MSASLLHGRIKALPKPLPGEHLHVLVDGFQYAEMNLPGRLAEQPGAQALFAGTEEESLKEDGPWLLAVQLQSEALCRDLLALEQCKPAVSWIYAALGTAELAAHLKARLDMRLPDGRSALVRFWDPRVLATLAQQLDEAQRLVFFDSLREWHFLLDGRPVHIGRDHD
ncbi:DUF4123 domain-containing protein [uncultured Herbaspirillum sp.]|uniref:DUF4123 domain-containing protein n=1 Tax=uncultured Herbaspirillum sp. TaxID=160236 RepID=UPI002619561B|nr:DUF4123 domain-containing protein [uncultured Herbaspirillum sp.]